MIIFVSLLYFNIAYDNNATKIKHYDEFANYVLGGFFFLIGFIFLIQGIKYNNRVKRFFNHYYRES